MQNLAEIIAESHYPFHPIIPPALQFGRAKYVNFNQDAWRLLAKKAKQGKSCWQDIEDMQIKDEIDIYVGRYGETRPNLYAHDQHHVHLGMDLVLAVGTPVFCPMSAKVHAIMHCLQPNDFGTTVILKHDMHAITFYSLYAHLSHTVILHLHQTIEAGTQIGTVGAEHENGGWPPHLHLQLLSSTLMDHHALQGVVQPALASDRLLHCPDPNLLLNMEIRT
jgi:murein DD-endopeptidase MepM/ murein hydrolase activator NlpD